jgi:hypothetical protein
MNPATLSPVVFVTICRFHPSIMFASKAGACGTLLYFPNVYSLCQKLTFFRFILEL